jgi:hypothetical protein
MAHAIALAQTRFAPMRLDPLRSLVVSACAAALIFARSPFPF